MEPMRMRGGGNTNWVPIGTYNVISITGTLGTSQCFNNAGMDGSPGTGSFFNPFGMDMDSAGNIIIVEKETDRRLRIMSPAGVLSTIPTTGSTPADGPFASSGRIYNSSVFAINKTNDVFYFLEYAHHQLRTALADSGKTFSGKDAPGFPAGMGTIISTPGNSTIDGNQSTAYLYRPYSIAFDPKGTRAYIGEEGGFFRMVDITGPATCYVSSLFRPKLNNQEQTISNIVVDNNGNVFFTMMGKHAIWKFVPPAAGVRTTGTGNPLYSFTDAMLGPKVFAGSITTPGYNDDPGSTALFNTPMGLCVDANNNLYVADCVNNVIRYITPDGTVYTYAGAQNLTSNLDGAPNDGNGLHTTARFSNPISVVMDPLNNLYVLDAGKDRLSQRCRAYCRIRKISRTPPITVTAVTTDSVTVTWPPPSEWMPNASSAADTTTYSYRITPSDRKFVVSGPITSPLTVSNLSDSTLYSIEITVSNSSQTVTTPLVPFATQIEPSKFVIRTPVLSTVGGNSGTIASLSTAILEWDGAKGADTLAYTIDPVDVLSSNKVFLPKNQKTPYCIPNLEANKTYTVRLTAGMTDVPGINGEAPTSYIVTSEPVTFTTPNPVSMEIGTLCGLVARGGTITNAKPTTPQAPSVTTIKDPRGVVLDKYGNLFITSHSCVLKVKPPPTKQYVIRGTIPSILEPNPHSSSTSSVTIYAGIPAGDSRSPSDTTGNNIRFYNITAIAYDPRLDCLYISDSLLHIIIKLTYDSTGLVTSKVLGVNGGNTHLDEKIDKAKFKVPKGIAVGADGSLFIADCYNHAVRKITGDTVTTIARATIVNHINTDKLLVNPYGVAVLNDGTVYVTSTWRNCIKKLAPNPDGTYTMTLYAGEDSDSGGDADGALLDARFNKPQGLFVDTNNNIYVYDVGNYKIKLISGGRVMTVFGTSAGYQDGDKGSAQLKGASLLTDVQYDDYAGITSDDNGNMYFSDWGNGLIRTAYPAPPPTIQKAEYDLFWNAQRASSAIAQTTSSARQVEATLVRRRTASSAVAQTASSALAQRASSAVAQVASSAQASSAVAQAASSAVGQAASSAQASSATAQTASSAVAQAASSAVGQAASSAQASSAVAQTASSAQQQQALIQPVSIKDNIVQQIKVLESALAAQVAILYSKDSAQSDKDAAKSLIQPKMAELKAQWDSLDQISATIFSIAPQYQDRELQTPIYDEPYFDSQNLIKMYDFMRKRYIVIDSNGYIVPNIDLRYIRAR
jgi:hypothetical protein